MGYATLFTALSHIISSPEEDIHKSMERTSYLCHELKKPGRMPVNYSITMLPNPMDKGAPPKAYAKAQISGEMSLKELAREVSGKCTVHAADIYAVLVASVESLITALKNGKQVDFGELGKFRLQICSKGAECAGKFTTANIKGVNIQFVPSKELQDIFGDLKFREVASRYAQHALIKNKDIRNPDSTAGPHPTS